MDIYSRLIDDHGKQRGLSGGLIRTSGDTMERRRLFDALKKEVTAHAAAEEQAFYAELIGMADGQEKARHSVSEHKEAADLLDELAKTDMASSAWLAKFKKLKKDLEHHMDEEEAEVFVLARSLVSEDRAGDLAREFDRRKDDEMSD